MPLCFWRGFALVWAFIHQHIAEAGHWHHVAYENVGAWTEVNFKVHIYQKESERGRVIKRITAKHTPKKKSWCLSHTKCGHDHEVIYTSTYSKPRSCSEGRMCVFMLRCSFCFFFRCPSGLSKLLSTLVFRQKLWVDWNEEYMNFLHHRHMVVFILWKLTGVRGLIFIFIVAFVHEKCKCFVLNCSVIMDTRSKQSYRKPFNSFVDFRSFRWVLQQSSVRSDTKRYNSRPFIRGVRGFFKARISICFADKFKFIELIGFFSVQSSK